jgi:hypothetical protein
MSIEITCRRCGQPFTVDVKQTRGKRWKCPHCTSRGDQAMADANHVLPGSLRGDRLAGTMAFPSEGRSSVRGASDEV